jgi:hypothetical protein
VGASVLVQPLIDSGLVQLSEEQIVSRGVLKDVVCNFGGSFETVTLVAGDT